MKVLIFGDTGFIGSTLKKYLISNNIETFGISRSCSKSDLCLDICNHKLFKEIPYQPDVVINGASILPENNALNNPIYIENVFRVNTLGAVNIANWAKENKIKKVFNLSTLVVTKKPWKNNLKEIDYKLPEGGHIAYCMSKISQERLMSEVLKNTSAQFTNLRLSAVYGSEMKHEGILFSLFDKAIKNEIIQLVNGETTSFNFIHVLDIARIIHILMQSKFSYDVINLASDKETKLIDLANIIKNNIRSSSVIENFESERLPSYSRINIDRLLKIVNTGFGFTPIQLGLSKLFQDEIFSNG